MSVRGIDVSSYQGEINWKQVAENGVEFAILKVIRKDLTADKQFGNNWAGATEAGVPIQGVYNYSYATNTTEARTAAGKVVDILNDRKAMVWMDLEEDYFKGIGRTLIDIIYSYAEVIENAGLKFGIYCNKSFYESCIKPYSSDVIFPIWIARYPTSMDYLFLGNAPDASIWKPETDQECYGWQYTSKGIVNGISGYVDLDELYVAVEAYNLVEESTPKEELVHAVGDQITVSSYYSSSTDPVEKALIKNGNGTILKIKEGTRNPYCFGTNGVATGWCNDGDIRTCNGVSMDKPVSEAVEYYVVKSGDNLTKIAKTYGTTVDQLVAWNNIQDKNKIYVNQKIRVR